VPGLGWSDLGITLGPRSFDCSGVTRVYRRDRRLSRAVVGPSLGLDRRSLVW
jgi:hypothetical protein